MRRGREKNAAFLSAPLSHFRAYWLGAGSNGVLGATPTVLLILSKTENNDLQCP